jgi:hypothetical protein
MSSTNSQDNGFTPQEYINHYYDQVQQFPRGKAWTLDTLPFDLDTRHSIRRVAKRARVIKPVGSFETRRKEHTVVNLWTLTEPARDILDEYEDRERQELPCGHVGFTNLHDSPYLQCNHCNGRYTAEEVRES